MERHTSVADALGRVDRLRCGEVVAVLAPVADALAREHAAGRVYGNVSARCIRLPGSLVGCPRTAGTPAEDVHDLAAVAVRCLLGGAGPVPDRWPARAIELGVPAALVVVLAAALSVEPGRRPSAREVAAALRATCGPLPPDRLLAGADHSGAADVESVTAARTAAPTPGSGRRTGTRPR